MQMLQTIKNTFYSLLGQRTIGARILLLRNQQILLVQHTYCAGWYTVGGAVDRGESPLAAIHRELYEEVGVRLTAPPRLFAVYYNYFEKRDDYVVLYVAEHFEQQAVQCKEILAQGWFDLQALPAEVSPATERRIEEYLGKRALSDRW